MNTQQIRQQLVQLETSPATDHLTKLVWDLAGRVEEIEKALERLARPLPARVMPKRVRG